MDKVSDFYIACRNGDINKVEQLLPTLSTDKINRLEPNGSTALHAASYYGHLQIIRLLLKRGDVLLSIRNKYDKIPLEEARAPEIEQLLTRSPAEGRNRFVDDTSTPVWIFTGQHANFIAETNYNATLPQSIGCTISVVDTYIKGKMSDQDLSIVKCFVKELERTRDVTYLLRLYTAQTDFYRLLNEAIATKYNAMCRTQLKESFWAMSFAGIICRDPALDKFRWARDVTTGITYRGMHVTETDLSKYNIGEKIMNRSFLSTSKERSIAENFLIPTVANKVAVLCTYTIIDKRAALDIHSISQFPHEQEVLIVPWMAFVVKRKELKNPVEIDLEQLPIENNI